MFFENQTRLRSALGRDASETLSSRFLIARAVSDGSNEALPLPDSRTVPPRYPVVASVADLEASLKIDAQCATWIDTQRQNWTEDVRDMGARVPFPLTNEQATHRAARFLDRLVASELPARSRAPRVLVPAASSRRRVVRFKLIFRL